MVQNESGERDFPRGVYIAVTSRSAAALPHRRQSMSALLLFHKQFNAHTYGSLYAC